MSFSIRDGVWPTMITYFHDDGTIDYHAMAQLIERYKEASVDGLFAICQSSEMFYLSLEERVALASFVKERAGNLQVIASGHVANTMEEQIEELSQIAQTNVDAIVLVSNRLGKMDDDEDTVRKNTERILTEIPNVPFGIYECPYPYKRLISNELLQWLDETGRFYFLKDTCCDRTILQQRLHILKDSSFKLFNANTATLHDSYQHGANGYSGVMANFHPELYVQYHHHWNEESGKRLHDFLTTMALYELDSYPRNAKQYNIMTGLEGSAYCRVNEGMLSPGQLLNLQSLQSVTNYVKGG